MIPADRTRKEPLRSGLAIRHTGISDMPAIVAIERESFVDPWDQQTFIETLSYFPDTFFTVWSGNEIAGFAVGGYEDTGENIYGHICNLAIKRSHQKAGIGRTLVTRLEQQFMIGLASASTLEVRVGNIPAQKFYRKLGYTEVFRIAEYYANKEDAIVMMKWFI
ncbi:MAG: ribosomal protein S18-alanine N-acetyltransferase [Methanoregulaceae archaeon]